MRNKLCRVNLNELREQSLRLPWKERLRLAQDLLESLHEKDAVAPAEPKLPVQQFDEPLLEHIDLEETVRVEATVERRIPLPEGVGLPLPSPPSPPSCSKVPLDSTSNIAESFRKLREALEDTVS